MRLSSLIARRVIIQSTALSLSLCMAAPLSLLVAAGSFVAIVPATAHADAASDSLEKARAGAGHFRAKRFLEAARAFQHAYRLNPIDPRNLRYAGRAWQEVGHWERALHLLERYSQMESKPALRQSIQPRIDILKKTTPRQRAEQLALATVKFPHGKLEIDAARALERLGKEADLKRAVKLYETARLWATSAALQTQVDSSIDRIKGKIIALQAAPKVIKGGNDGKGGAKNGLVTPPVVEPEPKGDTLGTVLYIVGGIAVVGGAGLGTVGYLKSKDATKNYDADATLPKGQTTYKGDHAAYKADVDSGNMMQIAGLALAGVGGGIVLWAVIRSATQDASAPASTTWWVSPRLDGEHQGLTVGLHF